MSTSNNNNNEQEGASKRKLVGFSNFVRTNPRTDRFGIRSFDHIEFWVGDATNHAARFAWALGMNHVAKSDQSTNNQTYASYVLKTGRLTFVFSSPYSIKMCTETGGGDKPHPGHKVEEMHKFLQQHGTAVRAIGINVDNAYEAFKVSVDNGAHPVLSPVTLKPNNKKQTGTVSISEVKLYGDVVLRYVSRSMDAETKKVEYTGSFLPGYEELELPPPHQRLDYGIDKLDHAVGNVYNLLETTDYVMKFTGFHEFAEFVSEDVGTVDSGLNSMVMANNNCKVLLPINEPTYGTRRKSQIQTYLEQNEGEGLQHLALKTNDIFRTVREMKKRSVCGGFSFMPPPSESYYKKLPLRIGDSLTEQQYKELQELELLADKDSEGVLLQVFTRPLGDRPTVFIEIIQRLGCKDEVDEYGELDQVGGCGGFGKGNFSELFKSIEEYEKTLNV